ncbi:MAG: 16S rRNA (guanine(527)-N(7))-methyltransferase RsmG [Anaerolineales bacterium]|nr:16S rRNA (guanine(527)-N(7))-methyltransferase RsmG [Anaerolineales bacterium]
MPLLADGCRQLGLALTPAQEAQFARYYALLVEWNERLNLTTITAPTDVQVKHYLDSLVALPLIAEELGVQLPIMKPLRVADVGTGAGFPGVPLKIAAPALALTLMDGTQKKIAFLEAIVATLGLQNVTLVHGRAEELGRAETQRERYDVVVARAVAPLNVLAEYVLPLVRVGGLAVAYKGPSAPQEFIDARKAIATLGGEAVRLAPVTVPHLDERRYILLIKKVKASPSQYPRGQGLARKKPL